MKTSLNRRNFIINGAKVCIGTCALLAFNTSFASNTKKNWLTNDEPIDPKKLNYCGYQCPADCLFLKGSMENNNELKMQAYELWKIKDRFGVEFDSEKIFCFGCKTKEKPEGIVLRNCTVRSCAMEKGIESCVECRELESCQKELWDRFPDFKKMVLEMQVKYFETQSPG